MKKEADFTAMQLQFNKELAAGDFAPAYLIWGSQSYLRLQNRDKLKKAMLGDGDTMNLNVFSGEHVSAREVIELAETMPFFAENRIIILENTQLFGGKEKASAKTKDKPGKQEGEASKTKEEEDGLLLAEYLGTQPSSTHFIFVQENIDKRKKLYKAIEKNGRILECDHLSDQALAQWAGSLFKKQGVGIDGRTLSLFLQYTGTDMVNIRAEADKLAAFCGENNAVTSQMVETITCRQMNDRVFDLIEAMAGGQRQRAMQIYMNMKALQTPAPLILSLMHRQYLQLSETKELMGKNCADAELAALLKVPPFALRKLKAMAGRYTTAGLRHRIERCIETDAAFKAGKVDMNTAVEMLVVESLTQA